LPDKKIPHNIKPIYAGLSFYGVVKKLLILVFSS